MSLENVMILIFKFGIEFHGIKISLYSHGERENAGRTIKY